MTWQALKPQMWPQNYEKELSGAWVQQCVFKRLDGVAHGPNIDRNPSPVLKRNEQEDAQLSRRLAIYKDFG